MQAVSHTLCTQDWIAATCNPDAKQKFPKHKIQCLFLYSSHVFLCVSMLNVVVVVVRPFENHDYIISEIYISSI